MTTFERFAKIVADVSFVDIDRITDGAALIDDLRLDSLDAIELIMGVEVEFDIEVSGFEAEACLTVGDAVQLIDRAVAARDSVEASR